MDIMEKYRCNLLPLEEKLKKIAEILHPSTRYLEEDEELASFLVERKAGAAATASETVLQLLKGIEKDLERINDLLDENRAPRMNGGTTLSLEGRIRGCLDQANTIHNENGTVLDPCVFEEYHKGVMIRKRSFYPKNQKAFALFGFFNPYKREWRFNFSTLKECREEIDQCLKSGLVLVEKRL